MQRSVRAILHSLVFASASVAGFAEAASPYVVAHSSGSYQEITTGDTYLPVAYGLLGNWDEGAATIALPFAFTWYGTAYSTIFAFTNGFLSFNAPPANAGFLIAPNTVPNSGDVIHNFIGVMWNDLEGGANAEIRSLLSGALGSRVFTIQYKNFRVFGSSGSSVNFQVRLLEASNMVEIVFGPTSGVSSDSTTAIENSSGIDGVNLMTAASGCSGACACLPKACGSSNWQPTGRTISITLPNGPELTGEIEGPRGAYANTAFDVDVRIRNLGLMPTAAFRYEIRLTPTVGDLSNSVLLEAVDVAAGVAASSTFDQTRSVIMPSTQPLGTFFLAIVADSMGVITEAIESNNTNFDLLGIATGPDLIGELTTPAIAGPGENMEVELKLESTGASVTTPVSVAFYLSTDQTFDAADLAMGSELITIDDGFSEEKTVELVVPSVAQPSPPSYYVLARLDAANAIAETREDNNEIASAVLTLEGPDVETSEVVGGEFGFLGLPYPLTARVQNAGGGTARDFTVCVVISKNLLITTINDPVLEEVGPFTLGPNETLDLSLSPLIPANTATGAWYLAVVADCADVVREMLETNNVRRLSDQIIVRDPAPDFAPLEVITTSSAASGETVPLAARVGNIGNAVGTAQVRIVVSDNVGVTVNDPTIYETAIAIRLEPGEETTISAWGALPGDLRSGSYVLGVIVDPLNTLSEIYEDNNALGTDPITIAGANLAIITPPPPNAVIGVPYVRRLSATGGSAAYAWTVAFAGGVVPAGLSFNTASAELSGIPEPSAEGRHEFEVRVSSGNVTASRKYDLLVTRATVPLSIVSSRLPPALAGEPYRVELVAVGGVPPYEWTITSPAPMGMGINSNGELSGEPAEPGAYTFDVTATDQSGTQATHTLAIDVINRDVALSITTVDVISATANTPYETAFEVSGGAIPYVWSMHAERSIPGLVFDSATTRLSGTPTVAGSYPFAIEVRDADGLIDRNAYVLDVFALGELVITTGRSPDTRLPSGKVGEPFLTAEGMQVRLRAVERSGGDLTSLRWTIVDGDLPPGLVLDNEQGAIDGTPQAAGNFAVRVMVTNSGGDAAFAALVVEVVGIPEVSMNNDTGCSCDARGSSKAPWAGWSLLLVAMLGLRTFRRRALLVAALTIVASEAVAQDVPYQVIESEEAYAPLSNGVELLPGLNDGKTQEIALPFEFYLYGEASDRIYVNANGLVAIGSIGDGHHYPPASLPNSFATARGFVAPLWDDWCSSVDCGSLANPGMGVFYEIDAMNGRVAIEWRHIRHFSDSMTASDINFKVVLFEGISSRFEISYGPMTIGSDFTGAPTVLGARIGLEDQTATRGMYLGPCVGPVACTFTQVAALTDHKVTVVADAGDDLAASSVSVPSVAYPGLPMEMSARVLSRHGESLGPVRVSAYLVPESAPRTSTVGGELVHTTDEITLSPFESRALTLSFEVPNSLVVGRYRLAVLVDAFDSLIETDERNNLAFSTTSVRITDRAPDFRVLDVNPIGLALAPGARLDVAYRVDNFGNETGTFTGRAYLSLNHTISISDIPIGDPISFDLASRTVRTGTITALLPGDLVTGRYWVGLIADELLVTHELSEANNIGRALDTIVISADDVAILTTELPPATVGLAYTAMLRAAGGNGQFSFELVNGSLPSGLSFDSARGELSGTALDEGSFTLEFEVTSGDVGALKSLNLEVIDPALPLTIVTHALPPAVLGHDYALDVRATGGTPPYRWRMVSGAPPHGIVLGSDGSLIGTPDAVGRTAFTVGLLDVTGLEVTEELSLETRAPGNLSVITTTLISGNVGEPYSDRILAVGGVAPVRFRSASPIPAGLAVQDDGLVSGVPEISGAFRFRVEATDASGNIDTNLVTIGITASGALGFETNELPVGRPGEEYRASIKSQGGQGPFVWSIVQGEGVLPPDFQASPGNTLTGDASDLVIFGRLPQEEGTWSFTVRLRDAAGRVEERPFAILSRVQSDAVEESNEGCTCVVRSLQSTTGATNLLMILVAAGLGMSRKRRRRS